MIEEIDAEELNVSNSFIETNVTSSTKTGVSRVDIDFGAARPLHIPLTTKTTKKISGTMTKFGKKTIKKNGRIV